MEISSASGRQEVLRKKTGIAHVLAACVYSLSGGRYLMRETAARHEVAMSCGAFLLFTLVGAEVWHYLLLACISLFTLCLEAINTAGESVVDRMSPDRSAFAKEVKDLLSFSVFCALLMFGGFVSYVLITKTTAFG